MRVFDETSRLIHPLSAGNSIVTGAGTGSRRDRGRETLASIVSNIASSQSCNEQRILRVGNRTWKGDGCSRGKKRSQRSIARQSSSVQQSCIWDTRVGAM